MIQNEWKKRKYDNSLLKYGFIDYEYPSGTTMHDIEDFPFWQDQLLLLMITDDPGAIFNFVPKEL